MNKNSLALALSRQITWKQYKQNVLSVVDPSERIVSLMNDSIERKHLRPIKTIARQPFIRDDNSFNNQVGYDESSHMYAAFDPKKFSIMDAPDKKASEKALLKLKNLLKEFSFANDHDFSAAISAILTATVRASLPVAPMFHICAPQIASGKSYLCQIISAFATARKGTPLAFPYDEEECRKLLLSQFMQAPAVIEFDNLTTDIKAHKSLCTALTSEYISDRILGVSKTATVCTRSLILSSGNNVLPINDMVRRCITVNLDTQCETPATRKFKNPRLLEELLEQRQEYVSAAITIIAGWLASGDHKPEVKSLASYERWSELCRYPLIWLGLPDPTEGVFKVMNEDPERETLGNLLSSWFEQFESKPLMVREMLSDKFDTGRGDRLSLACYEVAGERIAGAQEINPKVLGHYIKRHQNRIINDLRFVRVSGNFSSAKWKVESVKSD